MRIVSTTGAVVLLAASLAACGGVDKNAYVQSVTTVQKKTQTEANTLSAEMQTANTPKAIGKKLEELGTEVAANAKELDAIEAPTEVTKEHQQYVDLMNRFSRELGRLGREFETAKTSELAGILEDTTKLTSNLATDENKIVTSINTKLRG
jgi:ribosome assembly protein YihI (activator of Der GTPase)